MTAGGAGVTLAALSPDVNRPLKVILFAAAVSSAALAQPTRAARFELPHDEFLIDEMIPIVVVGLPPRATTVVRLRGGQQSQWTSSATFTADEAGRIDLAQMTPVKGSYQGADAMGLFWSVERERAEAPQSDEEIGDGSPELWKLTAEIDREVVASVSIRRRAVAAGVRVTPVRDGGLVGTFYEPPDEGHHPALMVLTGSGGGVPPPTGPAGGLASRGYSVLALAYFGAEGLPRTLSNIPLEYFGSALRWLAARSSVDPTRIGVLGASRGGELALLLGSVYPGIRTVVAYVPSNVVWRGCCDAATDVAWTVGGRAIAAMPPPGLRQSLAAERAEIPVERIHGSVLLISGHDDGVWPSAEMAEKIVTRLKRNGFPFAFESLTYDHAGHGISRPYASTMNLNSRRHPLTGRMVHLGGTPAGTAKASEDSWHRMLVFVDQHLRNAGPASEASPSATNVRPAGRSATLP
jgi:dienelactone hydrolase